MSHYDKQKEEMMEKQLAVSEPDMINPDHYKAGGIETIDYMQAKLTREEFIGYLKGNILKYTSRLGRKDADLQEAKKIQWYSNKLVEVLDA